MLKNANKKHKYDKEPMKTMYVAPQYRTVMRNLSPTILAESTESFFNDTSETK